MDGPRLSLAGRVVVALAVALALSCSGSSLRPRTTGAPPAQPAVRATPRLSHGILSDHVGLVGTAARHSQRNRRGHPLVAVLAAALPAALVAATGRSRVARSRCLNRRLVAFGARAPPLRF